MQMASEVAGTSEGNSDVVEGIKEELRESKNSVCFAPDTKK